jgi:membrane protease YdiL (CAAX protease family)
VQSLEQSEYYSQLPLPAEPVPVENIPSPNNPPWGVWAAVGVWVASVFFILLIPSLFVLPYIAAMNQTFADSEQLIEFLKSDPVSVSLQLIGVVPAHLLTLTLAWLVVTRARRFSFTEMLGWKKGGFRWWHYAIILVGFVLLASAVTQYFPEQENDLLRMLASSRAAVYIISVVATITAPIVEEVTYRGILYSAFQRKFGIPAAFIFVTFLFAVVHVPQYLPSYSTIFLLALLSLTLTAIRVKTNNLLPCIILHMLFNGMQSVSLILEPYLKSPEVQEHAAVFLRFLK